MLERDLVVVISSFEAVLRHANIDLYLYLFIYILFLLIAIVIFLCL